MNSWCIAGSALMVAAAYRLGYNRGFDYACQLWHFQLELEIASALRADRERRAGKRGDD